MHVLLAIGGITVLLAIALDLVWTTVGTHGGGPISRRLQSAAWRVVQRMHVASGRRHHYALSFVGTGILVLTIAFWICGNWLGWLLLFSADGGSVLDTRTRLPADLGGRAYFTAYAISSMGNGDFTPSTTRWRLATAVASLGGITAVTLAVSFILSVVTAVVARRTLGSSVSDAGGTPSEILRASWHHGSFESMNHSLLELTNMVQMFAEQHLAYPTIQFFHSESRRTSAPLRLFSLHETVLLLDAGVAEPARLSAATTTALRNAFAAVAVVFEEEHSTGPSRELPPPPDLGILRRLGVPTVSDAEFAEAVARAAKTRRGLHSILVNDGWVWDEAVRPEG